MLAPGLDGRVRMVGREEIGGGGEGHRELERYSETKIEERPEYVEEKVSYIFRGRKKEKEREGKGWRHIVS